MTRWSWTSLQCLRAGHLLANCPFMFLTNNFPSLFVSHWPEDSSLPKRATVLRVMRLANIPSNLAFVFLTLYFLPSGSFAFRWTNLSIFSYGSWVLCHVSKGLSQWGLHKCLLAFCPRVLWFHVSYLSILSIWYLFWYNKWSTDLAFFFFFWLYLLVNGLSPVPASSPKQSIFLFLLWNETFTTD